MIVIPMMGLSSRFYSAGYTLPKYQLPLNNKTVFDYVLESFRSYFDTDMFVFIIRDDESVYAFVNESLIRLGIKNFRIVKIENDTRGQSETVLIGTKEFSIDDEIYIFNIDTMRPGFSKSVFSDQSAGYLEVFSGEGDHWSFVEPGPNNTVVRTTEKERISNLCSNGLYQFSKLEYFKEAADFCIKNNELVKGEFYIAPLYNVLIKQGLSINYKLVDIKNIDFCGTPSEYESLLQTEY